MEKGKIKAAEMRKLKRIFKEIPENKKKIVEKLIDNAAFMASSWIICKRTLRRRDIFRSTRTVKPVGDEEGSGG